LEANPIKGEEHPSTRAKATKLDESVNAGFADLNVLHVVSSTSPDRSFVRRPNCGALIGASRFSVDAKLKVATLSFSNTDHRFELIQDPLPFRTPGASPAKRISPPDLFTLLENSDIVHIHEPCTDTGTITLLAAKQADRPAVITLRGDEKSSSLLIKWSGLSLAQRVICPSQLAARVLGAINGLPPIHVIVDPVDTEVFGPSSSQKSKRQQIVYVGPIEPNGGIDTILEVLPEGLDLIVCGEIIAPEYFERLQLTATGRSVRHVTAMRAEQVRELYRSSLVTVSPYQGQSPGYWTEIIALRLMESMSVGTPIICARPGPFLELLSGTRTGVSFGEREELADILKRVKNGEWPSIMTISSCIWHVREKFSLFAVEQRLASLYREAVQEFRESSRHF
jgi:glycosyltransferase involved in cell wall biosynthesis